MPRRIAWYAGPALSASAGRPGELEPPHATVPTLAQTGGVLAEPTTAWTVGDWVAIADGALYWTGVQWIVYGAQAGTPGTYVPASFLPASVALLNQMNVRPVGSTAAWTTGQSVPTGGAGSAHWTGTAWATGAA